MPKTPWTRTLGALLCALPLIAAAPATPDLSGRWVGAIVVEQGRQEVELQVDLESGAAGLWSGTMAVPVQGVSPKPLADLTVAGDRVSWTFEDASGRAAFHGTRQGDRIVGSDHEKGRDYPFELKRVGPPGTETCPHIELQDLHGVEELRAAFNRDAGKTRLLMVLPPSCSRGRGGAHLLQRYVLDRFAGADLAAYVVWMPLSDQDSRQLAEHRTCDLPDPRGRQFWTADRALSDALRPAVGLGGGDMVWDVYLVYGPGARWQGAAPPPPLTWMHSLGEPLPAERALDAVELAQTVAPLVR